MGRRVSDENGAYWRAKKKFDRDIITWALDVSDCKISEAADLLGLSYPGIRAMMDRCGLSLESLTEIVEQERERVIADLMATGQLPTDWADAPTKPGTRAKKREYKKRESKVVIPEGKDVKGVPSLNGKEPKAKSEAQTNARAPADDGSAALSAGSDFDLE